MQELVHRTSPNAARPRHGRESCTGGNRLRFTVMPRRAWPTSAWRGVVQQRVESGPARCRSRDDHPRGRRQRGGGPPMAAEGVRRALGADWRHRHDRHRGSSGGLAEKPVGTVWIAVATPEGTEAVCRQCERNAGRSSTAPRSLLSQCSAMRWSLPPEGSLQKAAIGYPARHDGTLRPPQEVPDQTKFALLIAEKVVYLKFSCKGLHQNNCTKNSVPIPKTKRFWSQAVAGLP